MHVYCMISGQECGRSWLVYEAAHSSLHLVGAFYITPQKSKYLEAMGIRFLCEKELRTENELLVVMLDVT